MIYTKCLALPESLQNFCFYLKRRKLIMFASKKQFKNPSFMSSSALMVAERKIQKKPVIIYLVPPKVIHADASEFMALVQRHTGKSADNSPSSPSPDAKILKPCKDSVISKARHRQFPVRAKARLALSRPSSENQYNGMSHSSSYLSEFVGHHHEDVPVASPRSNWLLSSEYSVESHNFIDMFQ